MMHTNRYSWPCSVIFSCWTISSSNLIRPNHSLYYITITGIILYYYSHTRFQLAVSHALRGFFSCWTIS